MPREHDDPMIDLERLRDDPAYEIARICRVDARDLDHALQTHPALFAYACALYERERARAQDAAYEYEKAKAREFSRLRDQGMAIGQAQEEAELADEVQHARSDSMEAEAHSRQLYALTKGLSHRRDMLIQLSARQRQEMQSL